MSHERNIKLLNDRRIVYKRDPVDDVPTHQTDKYMFFEQGTYECYTLFASKAKITTYKSLKWHLYVLWYLNPKMDQDNFNLISKHICDNTNGFVTFVISERLREKMIYDVSLMDLEKPPPNKLRKIIFKDFSGLDMKQKLSIVGKMVGRKSISESEIYDAMILLNDAGIKITIAGLAKSLNCSSRTVHRNMGNELKKEKQLLNQQLI